MGGGEQSHVSNFLRGLPGQVDGLIADHPRPGEIDRSDAQGCPNRGETLPELEGEIHMHLGRPPGQGEGSPNL